MLFEESERIAQSLLENISSPIAVLDNSGIVLAINRACRAAAADGSVFHGSVHVGDNYLQCCEEAGADHRAIATIIREIGEGTRAGGNSKFPCAGPEGEQWHMCRFTRFPGDGPPRIVVEIETIVPEEQIVGDIRGREAQLLRQRNALIALTGADEVNHGDLGAAIGLIIQTAARSMDVTRVSIWRFVDAGAAIQCVDMYDGSTGLHARGACLTAADYPNYFKALATAEIIAADDARNDPATREFAKDYFQAFDIASMMDVPVYIGGTIFGVLCHEHVGQIRHWTSNEKTFAFALANLIALAVEKSERREVEERLRLHSAALKAAMNGILITDPDGSITWVNPAITTISGYTLDEAMGRNPRDLVNSGVHDATFFQALWDTIRSGKVWSGVIINRRKNGTLYHEAQNISPIRDEAGAITHYVAIKEDVTEKMEVESTLHEARERLQRAVSAGRIALWEWDQTTDAVTYSAEWMLEEDIDLNAAGDRSEHWFQRVHPDDVGLLQQMFSDCANAPGTRYQREFRMMGAGREYRWYLMGASSEVDASGDVSRIIGTNIDITDRKRLEMEFQQSQKMESIGRLAGGVAHDFNNLLGVIGGYTEFVLETLGVEDPLREDVFQIKMAADRAVALTRQLLAFSRRQVLQPEVLNINTIVRGMEGMLRRLIGEDLQFVVALDPALGHVLADPGQLEQIVMNLAGNARDAMWNGGKLTIETSNVVVDEVEARQRPGGRPGAFVCLEVRDTGVGMDKKTQERIFEPFFTTKEQGKGTGLGLATVYGIVKQSGGSIWAESEPGLGSTFRVYLPRIDAPTTIASNIHLPAGLARGVETILLVEDEAALRSVTGMILARAGYTVIAAENAERAIALMERHAHEVHIVLTDVVMPGMSGPQLVDQLKQRRADLKVLFMSGYADDNIIHHGVLDGGIELINKPFTFAQLTHKIRDVLDGG